MKLVLIAYNEAVDAEVLELLDAAGAVGYTQWTQVLGKGRTSGPHLLSHIWPKGNNVLFAVVEDGLARELMEAAGRLRRTAGREGIKAFVLNVEDQLG
ncbi:MAG TPA: hypothetical protein VM031_00040 [Phycisphaerae bacterium]|nr:hypothetical protein [Phycisphaerae bacterium]